MNTSQTSKEVQNILQLYTVKRYIQVMMENLHYSFPDISNDDLYEAIIWGIENKHKNSKVILSNNYIGKEINTNMASLLFNLERLKPIITSSGVLYKHHSEKDNPLVKMIIGFLQTRKNYKAQMLEYPKGSEKYEQYNMYQLLEKINANAVYGSMGAPTSIFFNLYVAASITKQGRSYISTSITLFEAFLANSVKFNRLNEIITFISNITHESIERKFKDTDFLNHNISKETVFFRLINTIDYLIWVPSEREICLLWDIICGLDQENLNRIYFKNNLYEFCDQNKMGALLIDLFANMNEPFMDPNNPPENIIDKLNYIIKILMEYVYYKYPYIDKIDRAQYMQRDVVAVSDTDSAIITVEGWYQFMLDKLKSCELAMQQKNINLYQTINKNLNNSVLKRSDFDNNNSPELCKILEIGSNYRFSIINVITYICSVISKDYMARYCKLANSEQQNIPCAITMKNEFLFKSFLLVPPNKKNYVAIQELQEGKIINQEKDVSMVIAGLSINKSTLSDGIKNALKDILYNDIMINPDIDQKDVIRKLMLIEKNIIDDILNKGTTYYKPDRVKPISSYKNPDSINGVNALKMYQQIRTKDMPMVNMEEYNNIYKVKVNINKNNVDIIKDSDPEIYAILIKMLDDPNYCNIMHTIGFPLDIEIPDWVIKFIRINEIVNDNLTNFPLESVGIKRLGNNNAKYTNILKL